MKREAVKVTRVENQAVLILEQVVERKSLAAQTIARQAETWKAGQFLKQGSPQVECDPMQLVTDLGWSQGQEKLG